MAPNGVVRFYSPSTNYFLAMNGRGILYGTVREQLIFVVDVVRYFQ